MAHHISSKTREAFVGLVILLGSLFHTLPARGAEPPVATAAAAAVTTPAATNASMVGRERVRAVLADDKAEWKAPPNTVVYVVGGNFDYGLFHGRYMSPARTAAKELGLAYVDSTANPNGAIKDNAAKIRGDISAILGKNPNTTILVSANSKGFADFYEAMVDAPKPIREAMDQYKIGVFGLTPNYGGADKAAWVLKHPWAESIAKTLFSRARAPWDRRSLLDITPKARAAAIAAYEAKEKPTLPMLIATAHLKSNATGSDGVVPVTSQIPEGVDHERWDFAHATHGSFTSAGAKWSKSTKVQVAGLMHVHEMLQAKQATITPPAPHVAPPPQHGTVAPPPPPPPPPHGTVAPSPPPPPPSRR